MVPAALLGVEPSHCCLDLCASPGSKTTQLLESLYSRPSDRSGAGEWVDSPTGIVVANDSSPSRAYLLVRRCAALGLATSRLMIAAHCAQRFPNTAPPMEGTVRHGFGSDRYPPGQYDRVLCDVPCSGDGTLRKNPESWATWGPDYGSSLHMTQLQIAMRGAALLKVGGLMAYSTCSFNPVEDEAVVAELLRRARGSLELVDMSKALPTLRRRPGLRSWRVMDDDGNHYPTYKSSQGPGIPESRRRMYCPSMWPGSPAATQPLNRCLRLLPHLQDTGGFFVAVLRKVLPLPGPSTPDGGAVGVAAEEPSSSPGAKRHGPAEPAGFPVRRSPKVPRLPAEKQRDSEAVEVLAPAVPADAFGPLHSRRQAHERIGRQFLEHLEALFGLSGERWRAISSQLYWRVGGGRRRAVFYASGELSDALLDAPGSARLKQVYVGCRVLKWERCRRSYNLRLTAEGAELLSPLATRRVFRIGRSDMETLLRSVNKSVHASRLGASTAERLSGTDPGPCIWQLEPGGTLNVPGEVDAPAGELSGAARYPFLCGQEHLPRATARKILSAIKGVA
mmetsp:Transcript_37359/g.88808  ORF Transcript_37359/g.88808 Transcript_37359/m.88808 type:complete len:563 (-) Transcript_37359:198-1886(-)